MLDLTEFIFKTNASSSQDEVFALYKEALNQLGFDSVVYSLLTDHPSINRPKGHGVLGNYPKDWMDYYISKGYFDTDPIPRYAFSTSEAYTWDHVVQNVQTTHKQRRVMNEAREAKLLDGVAVAMYGPNHEVAGVGLASTLGGIKPNKDMLSIIRALSHQFHLAYSSFDAVPLSKPELVYLTPKEKEILKWAAEGKSNTVIATILSMSLSSVKVHLNSIFKKLYVSSRQTAVVKAIRLGLIDPTIIRPCQSTL